MNPPLDDFTGALRDSVDELLRQTMPALLSADPRGDRVALPVLRYGRDMGAGRWIWSASPNTDRGN